MPSFRQLSQPDCPEVIFRAVVGSHAYGTAHEHSDRDIRGIYVVPKSEFLTLGEVTAQVSDKRNDHTYYALHRFLQLALGANPNIIELLFMPVDCVLRETDEMRILIEHRSAFITKQAYDSHVGYARAQIGKAKGRNKWINNPQPEQPPEREDFCWIVPRDQEGMPYRPVPLKQTGVNLGECHAASLEHVPNGFRLYHYGRGAKGVFRRDMLKCESIPKEDEDARCIGLLMFNQTDFERARNDHKHYWEWRNNRNEARWKSQERGEMDYDAKNMLHTFRLIFSGEHMLRHGEPLVRFEGEKLAFLKAILAGEFAYEALLSKVEEKLAAFKALHDSCSLPEKADENLAEQLLRELTSAWEHRHER